MDIINQIVVTLKDRLGSNDEAYLYGSRARGTAKSDSDWDILILLDKDKLKTEDYDNVSYYLTYLGWDIDQIISPVMYTKKEWQQQTSTPFYKNVTTESIRLI